MGKCFLAYKGQTTAESIQFYKYGILLVVNKTRRGGKARALNSGYFLLTGA
jgi:hypothetical protein